MNLDFKKKISIGMIWLFHLSGLLGLLYFDRDLFVSLTPLNLIVSSTLLFLNQKSLGKKEIIIVILIFLIGMIAEILGVNYGLIFGTYNYGDNLGLKLLGVPLLIGLNWVILTFICGSISSHFIKNKYGSIIVGILLMLIIDLTIEPVAPIFNYWEFSETVAPIQNYIGWFFTSLLTLSIYQCYYSNKEFIFSVNLFLAQLLFFVVINFLG